jgi:outer membrane murein-binding lipoprotein Lpp
MNEGDFGMCKIKRFFLSALAGMMAFTVLTGCSSVSESDYDTIVSERDDLLAENEQLKSDYQAVVDENSDLLEKLNGQVTVSGYFTATVRSTIPDYVSDGETPLMVVVTCFQSSPFTLWLGDELISQVEVGETYVFRVRETSIALAQQTAAPQYAVSLTNPEIAVPLFGLQIVSIAPAEEEDYGLDASHLALEWN